MSEKDEQTEQIDRYIYRQMDIDKQMVYKRTENEQIDWFLEMTHTDLKMP